MDRRLTAWIVAAGMMALLVGPALAAEEAKEPDAILKLSEGSAGLGIGWSWAKGDLIYKGQTYKVKVEGLSVGEVGVTKAKALGKVSNLKNLDDFTGHYVAGGAGATAGKGVGLTTLKNDKGVTIELKSETEGANIKLAAEGLKLKLEK